MRPDRRFVKNHGIDNDVRLAAIGDDIHDFTADNARPHPHGVFHAAAAVVMIPHKTANQADFPCGQYELSILFIIGVRTDIKALEAVARAVFRNLRI